MSRVQGMWEDGEPCSRAQRETLPWSGTPAPLQQGHSHRLSKASAGGKRALRDHAWSYHPSQRLPYPSPPSPSHLRCSFPHGTRSRRCQRDPCVPEAGRAVPLPQPARPSAARRPPACGGCGATAALGKSMSSNKTLGTTGLVLLCPRCSGELGAQPCPYPVPSLLHVQTHAAKAAGVLLNTPSATITARASSVPHRTGLLGPAAARSAEAAPSCTHGGPRSTVLTWRN